MAKKEVYLVSGEGEQGTLEKYKGKMTPKAMKGKLTREMAGGDRWAYFLVDGIRYYHKDL